MWQDFESVLHHPPPHESETRLLPQQHGPDNGGHLSDFSEYNHREVQAPSTSNHQPNYYNNYDLAAVATTVASATSSSSPHSYELDLSVHSNSSNHPVKCEPDTTHKDTKMDDISSSTTNESRSPYMDLYPATHYSDNNNDLPKLEPINYYENNHRYVLNYDTSAQNSTPPYIPLSKYIFLVFSDIGTNMKHNTSTTNLSTQPTLHNTKATPRHTPQSTPPITLRTLVSTLM